LNQDFISVKYIGTFKNGAQDEERHYEDFVTIGLDAGEMLPLNDFVDLIHRKRA
jgi:hypothetical protein